MKKIFDKIQIDAMIRDNPYHNLLQGLNIPVFLIEYKAGEFISAPWVGRSLFQIICRGKVEIYYIRNDGTRYSLAQGSTAHCLGEMELFEKSDSTVCAQAVTDVDCLAFSIPENRASLLASNQFLRMVCRNMSAILSSITMRDADPSSLSEKVWNYMNYMCEDKSFKGLEKTAFQLRCSARQLQRIMNEFENRKMVRKTGKGSYQLIDV